MWYMDGLGRTFRGVKKNKGAIHGIYRTYFRASFLLQVNNEAAFEETALSAITCKLNFQELGYY